MLPLNIGQGDPAAPASFNPLLASSISDLQAATLLYRPLIWPGPDGKPAWDAGLAQSVSASSTGSPPGTDFRITLKPWRWSDGLPVTADDVVFGWQMIATLGDLYAQAGTAGMPDLIETLRASGPETVDIHLRAPRAAAWFTANALPLLYALPRHAWTQADREYLWRHQDDPAAFTVTDGPFRLAQSKPDRFAVFTPNPLYGGAAPHLARLVLTFQDGSNPLQAVQAGDTDLARVPYMLWQSLTQHPPWQSVLLPEPHGFAAIVLNLKRPDRAWLHSAALRRALAQGIDQKALIRLVYRGLATENHVPAPQGDEGWRDAGAGLGHDLAAARAEFAAAGWRRGADGFLRQGSEALALTLLTGASADDSPEMQALQLVQRDWQALGIAVRLRRTSFDQYIEILTGPADGWDAASVYETLGAMPDGAGLFDTGGANNFGGYANPAMDARIAASLAAPQALADYFRFAAAEQPWIILPQGEFPVLASPRLHGIERMQNPLGYWRPENLWVDDDGCQPHGKS